MRSTRELAGDYEAKRDLMMDILGRHGFTAYQPGGAYYVMADVSRFGFASDSEFAQYLVKDIGVATVPGSSFYIDPAAAPQTVRFCFSKRDETLHEADRRLARLLRSLQAIEPDPVFFRLELSSVIVSIALSAFRAVAARERLRVHEHVGDARRPSARPAPLRSEMN